MNQLKFIPEEAEDQQEKRFRDYLAKVRIPWRNSLRKLYANAKWNLLNYCN